MSREIVAFSVSAGLATGRMQRQQQSSTTSHVTAQDMILSQHARFLFTARENMPAPTRPCPHEPARPRAPGRPETTTTVLCCDF